jgi:DNA ligase D-like protein (predicted 3'-phosphoesterase)
LRLEVGGVLKSWAVPKGPSLNPAVKRLAVPTEDHPLDYADFEGTIPEGNYGAGTVLVWDIGTYSNIKRIEGEEVPLPQQLDNGQVEVRLNGRKLAGGYALVRTGGGDDARWLLIKMSDEHADRQRDVTAEEPESVLSGRTLEEIAEEASAEGGDRGGRAR